MILDEKDIVAINKAADISDTNYTMYWLSDKTKSVIEPRELIGIVKDLIYEYNKLKDEYNDLKQDIKDNYTYKPQNPDWHDIQEHRPSWWYE